MNDLGLRSRVVVFLSALIGAGGTALAQEPASRALDNPVAGFSLGHLSATLERPLFAPTRRPPPPPVLAVVRPPDPKPPSPPPSVALFGIITDAEQASAVLRVGPADKIMRVHIGDEVEGWKVTQIDWRKLVLSQNNRSATFTLFSDENAHLAYGNTPISKVAEKAPTRGARNSPGRAQRD